MPAIASRFQFPWAEGWHLSQSVRTGHIVVASGQSGFDDDGEFVDAGFEGRLRHAFRNLHRVLRFQGSSLDGVLRRNTCRSDRSQDEAFKTIRAEFLTAPYPASTAVVVGFVFPGMLCEVDAIAVRGAVRASQPDGPD